MGCLSLFPIFKAHIRKDKVFIFHNYSGSHTIDFIRETAEGTNQLAESKIGKVTWKGLCGLKQKTSHVVREQKEGASKTTNLLLILHNLLYWGCPNGPTSIEYTRLLCLFAVARLVLHPDSNDSDLSWKEALQPCLSLLFEVTIRRFQGDSSSCPGFNQHTDPDFNKLNIRGKSNHHLWNKTDVLSALEKELLSHETHLQFASYDHFLMAFNGNTAATGPLKTCRIQASEKGCACSSWSAPSQLGNFLCFAFKLCNRVVRQKDKPAHLLSAAC